MRHDVRLTAMRRTEGCSRMAGVGRQRQFALQILENVGIRQVSDPNRPDTTDC
jgi:hypothetical protein